MAYGDYSGPDKADKGKEGGSCNRGRCQCSPANWYNHGSYAWYCDDCRQQIEFDTINSAGWQRDFYPRLKHPMFETREMMDARKSPSPETQLRGVNAFIWAISSPATAIGNALAVGEGLAQNMRELKEGFEDEDARSETVVNPTLQ